MLGRIGRGIERILRGFIKGSDVVQIVCLSGIILNYAVMIILRVFGINYRAMEETVLLLALWSYAIGAYQGTYFEEHIAAGLIQGMFKTDRAKAIHKIILDSISLIVTVILTIWIWKWCIWAVPLRARSTVYGYPLYWRYFATLAMYGFSVIFFVRSCVLDLKRILQKQDNKEVEAP